MYRLDLIVNYIYTEHILIGQIGAVMYVYLHKLLNATQPVCSWC